MIVVEANTRWPKNILTQETEMATLDFDKIALNSLKKEKKASLTFRIEEGLREEFMSYCAEKGLNHASIVRELLTQFLAGVDNETI